MGEGEEPKKNPEAPVEIQVSISISIIEEEEQPVNKQHTLPSHD